MDIFDEGRYIYHAGYWGVILSIDNDVAKILIPFLEFERIISDHIMDLNDLIKLSNSTDAHINYRQELIFEYYDHIHKVYNKKRLEFQILPVKIIKLNFTTRNYGLDRNTHALIIKANITPLSKFINDIYVKEKGILI